MTKEKKDFGTTKMVNWNELNEADQIEQIRAESKEKPVLIFKHSTRCSISQAVLDRLERNWKQDDVNIKTYFLDLISYRSVSNQVAEQFSIDHESPQVLIIHGGKAVYDQSHLGITFENVKAAIKNQK